VAERRQLSRRQLNFRHIVRFAQTLERGKFDAFFMADHLALLNMPMNALKRSVTSSWLSCVATPSFIP
jgi:alkanesulfonate monooxygenase SsuD/methylene tetrahydromethanopterin reductase-like flavin-dependent oxidoreductase (luciferase family)